MSRTLWLHLSFFLKHQNWLIVLFPLVIMSLLWQLSGLTYIHVFGLYVYTAMSLAYLIFCHLINKNIICACWHWIIFIFFWEKNRTSLYAEGKKMQIITLTTKVLVSRHEKCDYALTFIRQQQSTGSRTRYFQFPLESQWICQQHIYPPSFSAFREKWEIYYLEWMYHVQHFSKNTKTNNNNKKHNKLQLCIAQRLLLPSNIKWWCTTSWTLSGGDSVQLSARGPSSLQCHRLC